MKNNSTKTPDTPVKLIPKGVKLCIENVSHLLNDAKLLHDKKRYASSIVTSIIAFEEIGKARMLRNKWIKGKPVKKLDWDNLTNHLEKSHHMTKVLVKESGLYKTKSKKSKMFKTLEKNMAKSQASELIANKKSFTFVNWSNMGWHTPTNPWHTIYADVPKTIEQLSYRQMRSVEKTLSLFLNEKQTEKILSIQTTPHTNIQDIGKLIEQDFENLTLTGATMELGEITRIQIRIKHQVSDSQRKMIQKELHKIFPFLEKGGITNNL